MGPFETLGMVIVIAGVTLATVLTTVAVGSRIYFAAKLRYTQTVMKQCNEGGPRGQVKL